MKSLKTGFLVFLLISLGYGQARCSKLKPEHPVAEPVRFYLFYVNDLQGEIDLCGCPSNRMGGVARRAKFIQRFFALKEQVVQVDAGDSFFRARPVGAPLSEEEKQRAMVLARSSAKMKVDAINIGLLDLAGGVGFLNELKEQSKDQGELNLLSSNLVNSTTKRHIFSSEKIIERAGLKIGIFGVCPPSPNLPPDLSALDPQSTAEQMVKKLKQEKKVDLVIGLFNLGLSESKRIVQMVSGIDFVVVSGMPQYLLTPELLNQTVLLQSGAGGKYLGQLEITYHQGKKSEAQEKELRRINEELKRIDFRLKELENRLNQDPGAKVQYEQLKKEQKIYQQKKQVLSSLPFDYKHTLVPIAETLPLDYEIHGWVRKALGYK